jgi:hypothetical protein
MVKRAPFIWVACAVHVLRHFAQEGKDMFRDDFEHGRRGTYATEVLPAHRFIGDAVLFSDAILAFGKDAALDRLARAVRFVLGEGLRIIQARMNRR